MSPSLSSPTKQSLSMSMARSKATNDDNNQLTFVHKQLPAILQLLADEQGAVSAARCA